MLTSSFTSSLRLASILTAKPSILLWKIGHVHHRMNFVRIIEWILLKLSNEYCLNCFINVGENRMHIKANLSILLQVDQMNWTKSNIFKFYCQYVEIIKRIYATSNIDTFRQPYIWLCPDLVWGDKDDVT